MPDTYKFTNKETGQEELVTPVKWRWIAHYKDGTKLCQYDDETGLFHQIKEIDRTKLQHLQMVSLENPHGFKLEIPEEAEMVHFYRNFRPAGSIEWLRFFIFGWKIKLENKVFKQLIQIMPDDTIRLLNDDGRG
jgi:hypothetical protein